LSLAISGFSIDFIAHLVYLVNNIQAPPTSEGNLKHFSGKPETFCDIGKSTGEFDAVPAKDIGFENIEASSAMCREPKFFLYFLIIHG
jgi:hypothetical protein